MSNLESNNTDPKEVIKLKNVRTHNLKGIDLEIDLGQLTTVTGVSGSGKSSLVFDTLYSEAYRRYVESLSSFARQYLKTLPKPDIESVSNLPPAIAVKQSRSGSNSRSTVGSLTELIDLLRVMFTHLSDIICYKCQTKVVKDTPETATKDILARFANKKSIILAPLKSYEGIKPQELKNQLIGQGFTRLALGPKFKEIARIEDTAVSALQNSAIVIDRFDITKENFRRISESVELAFRISRGEAIAFVGGDEFSTYYSALKCNGCGTEYYEPTPSLLSFNHPLGACTECQGFGSVGEVDWDKVTPDQESSLDDEGVIPWNFGDHREFYDSAKKSAKKLGIDYKKPFAKYTAKDWKWLKEGDNQRFVGVVGYFKWLDEQRYKAHYRIHAARFRLYVTCPTCSGFRLKPVSLACKIMGKHIGNISRNKIDELGKWLTDIEAHFKSALGSEKKMAGVMGLREAIEEAKARVEYLLRVGVSYLTVERTSRTLSGGEMQRINMARSLGSALTETMFCLDEPTCGLHPRDSKNLLDVMRTLRDQGNTVVVVEHEKTIIEGTDVLIEIGPEAGHRGGEITYQGEPKKLKSRNVEWTPTTFSESQGTFFDLRHASKHNLKDVAVKFPIGKMTVVCGVSGSGKTSLIQHTLHPLLEDVFAKVEKKRPGDNACIVGKNVVLKHSEVMLVSQSSLGRSSRSNMCTYLGFFDEIRKLLASTPDAKKLRLMPGSFSFNVPGGRCETCKGIGTVDEDLSFLGEMAVVCGSCGGKRFTDEVLSVEFRGKNLISILNMTANEARGFFHENNNIAKSLDAVIQMGLGYLTLGQDTSSFSGGEAQRLKLTQLVRQVGHIKPTILIFDEPTTGLSDFDVKNFINQMKLLTNFGHTLIVVEHHVGVLKSADWLIEIGPESAETGGYLVYQGIPANIKSVAESRTAPYLL